MADMTVTTVGSAKSAQVEAARDAPASLAPGRFEAAGVASDGFSPYFNGTLAKSTQRLAVTFDVLRASDNEVVIKVLTQGMEQEVKFERNPFAPDPADREILRAEGGMSVKGISDYFNRVGATISSGDNPVLTLHGHVNGDFRAAFDFQAPIKGA